MASTQYQAIQVCRIRIAQLTEAGAPRPGAGHGYCTDAIVSIDPSISVESGDELVQKNGCGDIVSSVKTPDQIKGSGLSMDLCQLDSALLGVLGVITTYSSGGRAVGGQILAVGSSPSPVCVEAWSKAWDGGAQAVTAFTSPDATYIRWVWPYVKFQATAFPLESGLQVITVVGVGQENTRLTVNGPFDDFPSAVANAGGVTAPFGWFEDDSMPAASDSPISVTSAAS